MGPNVAKDRYAAHAKVVIDAYDLAVLHDHVVLPVAVAGEAEADGTSDDHLGTPLPVEARGAWIVTQVMRCTGYLDWDFWALLCIAHSAHSAKARLTRTAASAVIRADSVCFETPNSPRSLAAA